MFLQSLGRDSIYHIRLQDTPTSGALSHLGCTPAADFINAVPTELHGTLLLLNSVYSSSNRTKNP
jgi:hypothetical protein